MRKILLVAFAFFLLSALHAQTEKQFDSTVNKTKALISTDRVKLLNNVDFIANMQYAFNNDFADGKYTGSRFSMNQFRMELKGRVFEDKVYFRFRNRYTRAQDPQSVDNIIRSTYLAFIRLNV